MPDKEPGTARGSQREPKVPGTVSTPLSGDLSPHAPDSGIGEAKPNTSLIPQPPIFDQDLIRALRNNHDAEKLTQADTRLINKFLWENGINRKEYRKMDAKTKVAAAAGKVELRINTYITDANAYAKKKVEERGFAPQEDFDSPFGPDDQHTVESQKKAVRNRLLSGRQVDDIQPAVLEVAYMREIAINLVEQYLSSNRFPDLYTLWAKTPDDIITECSLKTRIDDEEKEAFLKGVEQSIPFGDGDQYAQDIRELETSIPNEMISQDSENQFTSFAKVNEVRRLIRRTAIDPGDALFVADAKFKETFRILAEKRLILPLPDGDAEDLTDEVIRLKNGNGENGNGSGQETHNPDTTPSSEANPHTEEPDNLGSNFKERFKKMKEDSQMRAEKFLETLEQRLKDEIPTEELQAVLDNARMSIDDIDTDPLSRIIADLEGKGLHISQDIKNELEEAKQEQVPKVDFAETLKSYVSQLSKKDSARFLLETRYGKNLEKITQEDAKMVLESLLTASNQDDLGEKDTGTRSKVKKFLSRFRREKEKEPKKSKSEKSSKQPDFIDLDVEKESLWSKAGKVSGKIYRQFTHRKEKETIPKTVEGKEAKSKRLKKIMALGAVVGIGVVVAGLCLYSDGDGNENARSGQETPTIVVSNKATVEAQTARADLLTAQAEYANKQTKTAEAEHGSTTPTVPTSEPTTAPTTAPPENPQNPTPPSQPPAQVRSSNFDHDQAVKALDLADGAKDGFVDVSINELGSNFDNSLAQTLEASGLNLINKDNLNENGAIRWKWTLLASDGDGEKYHWVYVGDKIKIPADKLADAYRWSNVVVPDKIASQIKQVSTQVESKNESVVTDYGNHKQQQAANEQPDQSVVDFSDAGESISRSNLNGEIDVKNLAPNVKVHVGSTQDEFQNYENAKNVDGHTGFVDDIVDSPVQSPITKKTSQQKYSPTTNFKTTKEDEQMRFVAATLYEKERQKQLKRLRLKLHSNNDDEEDFNLLANL